MTNFTQYQYLFFMRKRRKYPDMMGSIRKHKKALAFDKKTAKLQRMYSSQLDCSNCVSEPICLDFKIL